MEKARASAAKTFRVGLRCPRSRELKYVLWTPALSASCSSDQFLCCRRVRTRLPKARLAGLGLRLAVFWTAIGPRFLRDYEKNDHRLEYNIDTNRNLPFLVTE
jgi:hypothetical protein